MYGERGIRLLTGAEYSQSLKDIFGSLRADLNHNDFPVDLKTSTFINQKNHYVDPVSIKKYWHLSKLITAWAIENKKPFDCSTDSDCASKFINTFAYKLFRRPLTESETATYQNMFTQLPGNEGLEAALLSALTSPQFLYRSELGMSVADALRQPRPATPESDFVKKLKLAAPDAYVLTPFDYATNLSYTLTGSTPDDLLLAAAKNGDLEWDAERLKHINRLLDSPNGRRQTGTFAGQWFNTDYAKDVASVDQGTYSTFIKGLMAEEVRQLFSSVFYNPSARLGDFYAADYVMIDGNLANYYKISGPNNSIPFTKISDISPRGGLFTTGAFNVVNSSTEPTDFKPRAVSVREKALCQTLEGTNRQYTIDALAKGLREFDANGLVSDTGAQPGTLYGPNDANNITTKIEFSGAKDLGQKIADLPSVQSCFISNALTYIEASANGATTDAIIAKEKQNNLACSKTRAEAIFYANNKSPRSVFTHFISQDFIRFRK